MPSFKTPIAIPIIRQEDFSVWRSHLVKDQSWTLWFWVEVDLRRSPVYKVKKPHTVSRNRIMPSFKTPITVHIIRQEHFSGGRSHLVKDKG
ncbi:hypothetical protein [Cylindrospermopsis raciborskii]|uniref:hypothetical protein n=1 Tax=Cylindrospermopsis raciborskii TaxID=77022 RepID=UPI001454D4BF|nr:hypothetical protein [Cylindrospermopsis raciborskii]NLQ06428.1 hypothetical protein [Cylindrospermopsis raciborskii MVCC19]